MSQPNTSYSSYIIATRTPSGYQGTIVLNGEKRWIRNSDCPYALARSLRKCYPAIDHVLTEDGQILDTGELSLGECIEASAFKEFL